VIGVAVSNRHLRTVTSAWKEDGLTTSARADVVVETATPQSRVISRRTPAKPKNSASVASIQRRAF
jgi:hypothetical protein